MKRRVVVIIAMLVTLLTISAEAVGLRAIGGMPRLTLMEQRRIVLLFAMETRIPMKSKQR